MPHVRWKAQTDVFANDSQGFSRQALRSNLLKTVADNLPQWSAVKLMRHLARGQSSFDGHRLIGHRHDDRFEICGVRVLRNPLHKLSETFGVLPRDPLKKDTE